MARHKLRSNKIKDGGSHVVAEQQLSSNKIKDGGSYVVCSRKTTKEKQNQRWRILSDIAEHLLSTIATKLKTADPTW